MRTKHIIHCIGKLQKTWQKEAIHMFYTRIKPFGEITIIEHSEGNQKSSKPNINNTKKIEAQKIISSLQKNSFIIALDETGKQLSSIQLAQTLNENNQNIIEFIIGGSWGLDDSILKQANLILSLGKITLPHSLARIILLEQIYRSDTINNNKKYHK